ncbi:uncharacterized protein LOC103986698 isoform X1 [Musa acuminata AAA Group]|uniref:uncharacterized protein LOC103986698 isoform X1 n=1 Tax=Musa acuminata AAA Group TaxID=214697 RepID=UPI0031E34000
MAITCCSLCGPLPSVVTNPLLPPQSLGGWSGSSVAAAPSGRLRKVPALLVRASVVDSSESSSRFAKRMERAWLISQQPTPIACSSCGSNGSVECKWCAGTGFFILGNKMLCEVPSRNTTCVICMGKGSASCPDCKGTGFRAKWLEEPRPPSE